MNVETARSLLYDAVEAAAATITPVPPILWMNRFTVDRSQQLAPYLEVDLEIGSAVQMSLGLANRVVRYDGMLAILVCVKEGSGIATASVMLDKLILGLGMKTFSGLQTKAAMPQRPLLEQGWHRQPLAVPFWFDDLL